MRLHAGYACPDCYGSGTEDHATTPTPCRRCDGGGLVAEKPRTYGLCSACGSVEVALNRVDGHRDLSGMGESPRYPIGYGCEVCS